MMNKLLSIIINGSLLLILLSSSTCLAQSDSLKIFDAFIGHEWTGHYVDSEDSALVHHISWEYCLGSNYVKQIKEVPEVGFVMETFYYWDYENKQISSLALLNKKMLSKGKVKMNNGRLEIYEKSFFPGGHSESKKTFEITETGNLKDYFYRKKSNEWVRGHFIEYKK